jgi:hypothetical protein
VAELTQTEFDMLYLRRSVEDCEFILEALKVDGEITVVPDPARDAPAARKKSKTGARKKSATGAKVKRPTGAKVKRPTGAKSKRTTRSK